MLIVNQSAPFLSTLLPAYPLLAAPPKRPALSAPRIAGLLPAPKDVMTIVPKKRVVVAEITNPLKLINIYEDPDAWWAEFERLYGRVKTIEEMDAEIEAKHPGMVAFIRGAIAS